MDNDTGKNVSGSIGNALVHFRDPAVKGITFLVPIAVTFALGLWFLGFISAVPGMAFIELTSYFYINQLFKAFFLVSIGSFFVVAAGKLARTEYGSRVEETIDGIVGRVPVIGAFYSATKKTTDTVLGESDLGKPVKVNFGSMQITGFETGNANGEQSMVFLPTSPNITSGFLVEIDNEWVHKTGETRTEAITRVLSAGFGARAEEPVTDGKKIKRGL